MSKRPVFAATAVLTLAIAIGGNTAAFTVIRAVLFKPLPYPDSERLVNISGGSTPLRFAEMRAAAHSFTRIGAFTSEESPTLSGAFEPEVIKGVHVSANFLEILQVNPLRGRTFRADEDAPGAPPVVMISYNLWQRRFGADPAITGKTATLAGAPYTVIGVLPPQFSFPFPSLDVWMTDPSDWPIMPAKTREMSPFLTVFARLKPGVSLAQAMAETKVIQHRYALAHPTKLDAKPKGQAQLMAMKEELVTGVRSMLWMLFGAVSFVLLIACANVAGLLLARAASRSREMAVRSALGAGRVRLVSQLLAESLVLASIGGTLGILFATWSVHAIAGITAFDLPRAQEIHVDWVVLAFAAALSIITSVLFGMAPAVGASRPDLVRFLRSSGNAAQQSSGRRVLAGLNLRGVLLIGQVALSIVLLIGAALLVESVSRLRGVAIGFDPSNILTASISLPPSQFGSNRDSGRFFQQLIDRMQTFPEVRSAAVSMFLPMQSYAGSPVQDAAKPPLKLNERPITTISVITPGYFHTLGIPFERGRDFSERDKEGTQRVAIIDDELARRFWPDYPRGLDPIGQHLIVGSSNPKPAEIVGIVGHVRQDLENTAWPGALYVAFAQSPQPFGMVAIKTKLNPLAFAGTLREQVRKLNPNQSVSVIESMNDLVDHQVGQRRLLVILLESFAAVAVLLVLVGIYGIIAHSVAQRMQEMGIRRALGAQHRDILRLVVGESIWLTVAGAGLGIGAAFGLTRLMQSLLFHISATDPATFVTVVALFVCVALVASYIPARRALDFDPAQLLKQ